MDISQLDLELKSGINIIEINSNENAKNNFEF